MISIRLQSDAIGDLQKKAAAVGQEKQISMVGAEGAADLTRQHLFALNLERSPRSNFYSRAAKSVRQPQPDGKGASFTINQIGLAQRWLGGDIQAGKGTSSKTGELTKYLAIGTDEVEGKTPAEVADEQDMAFVKRKNGKGMLVQGMLTTATTGKNKGQPITVPVPGGRVLFWLVPGVKQDPDPTVLPLAEDLQEAARYRMNSYLTRILKS